MVVPHAAVAHAAERQVVQGCVQQTVVDSHSAGHGVVDIPLGQGFIVGVDVEGQGAVMGVDVVDHLLWVAISLDWQ